MGLIHYLKDTKGELKHVSWPTRKQSILFTIAVVAISIAVAVFLGAFDALFSGLLKSIAL